MFCLLMTMYDQLEEEGSIDVYQTAKLYRTQRPQFIETEVFVFMFFLKLL